MGKAPKLLTYLVDAALLGTEEVQALINKGHTVHTLPDGYDLILAPHAWRMTPYLLKHIDAATKAARAVKYPPKKKDSTV